MSNSLWSQVIGHDEVLRRLAQEIAHDRVAQAYLFCGPDAVGKTTVARAFAQRLNCTAEVKPCGECQHCRAVALENPSYIQITEPQPTSKAKEADQPAQGEPADPEAAGRSVTPRAHRNLLHKVEVIRGLIRETTLRPLPGITRCMVLQSAHLWNDEGANAFLKTLEEPPPRMVLLLTSEQPEGLLPTVVSRLRRLDLSPVPAEAIASWLQARHGVPADAAQVAAQTTGGRPGAALRAAKDPEVTALRDGLVAQLATLRQRPKATAIAWAAGMLSKDGDVAQRMDDLLEFLSWWYRDALVLCTTGETALLANQDRLAALEAFAAQWQPAELRDGLAALHLARTAFRRNVNEQLMMEVLWLRLARGGRPAGLGA